MMRPVLTFSLTFLIAACGSSVDSKGGKKGPSNNGVANNGVANNGSNNGEATCGDGQLDAGELCDPGIASGAGSCPTTCQAGACSTASLVGSPAACTAQCVTEPLACANGDGCCPSGCDANSDNDCTNSCGDGVTESPEVCDGNCPQSCDDGDACTTDALTGNAAACSAICSFTAIEVCSSGDGCCPAGCTNANDSDCAPTSSCGDGIVDQGEACDGNCPTACNDGNACTTDTLTGAAATCNARCTFQDKTACQGGDGCCPAGCTSANDSDCACVPRTCAQMGAQCGTISDGCGQTIQCTSQCSSFETCNQNSCVEQSKIGEPCADYPECGSSMNAACVLPPAWPGGYCSIVCNNEACPAGAHCADFDGTNDLCMVNCTSNADCRNGYECRNWDNAGPRECVPPVDNTKRVGDACMSDADCPSSYYCETSSSDSNGDPITFPGGSCTAQCFSPFLPCPTTEGVCVEQNCTNACSSDLDCRPGYGCFFSAFTGKSGCYPN